MLWLGYRSSLVELLYLDTSRVTDLRADTGHLFIQKRRKVSCIELHLANIKDKSYGVDRRDGNQYNLHTSSTAFHRSFDPTFLQLAVKISLLRMSIKERGGYLLWGLYETFTRNTGDHACRDEYSVDDRHQAQASRQLSLSLGLTRTPLRCQIDQVYTSVIDGNMTESNRESEFLRD